MLKRVVGREVVQRPLPCALAARLIFGLVQKMTFRVKFKVLSFLKSILLVSIRHLPHVNVGPLRHSHFIKLEAEVDGAWFR